ncbi:MAG: HAMP domain-containing sensor histidine kinase [Eubacteriales bacterium]|nr:HAMP domain-containing sensor histidine kinase [Eubacteriales bacterium]
MKRAGTFPGHTETTKQKGSRKKKPPKFHSIRSQIAVLFIGMLMLALVSITVINGLFLETYYISKKTDVLLEAMHSLETLDINVSNGEYDEDTEEDSIDIPDELRKESSENNLSWIIINGDNRRLAYVGDKNSILHERLFGYIYDLDLQKARTKTIEEKEGRYIIQQVNDKFAGMDYVEIWGRLGEEADDIFFLIRTPLESIRESVEISNSFYFFVGISIIFISGSIIWMITKRIARPISELTKLSERMSNLDFDARYQSRAGNEIDVLGDNFNRMSKQLERTISELKSANNKLQQDIEDKIKIDKMRKEFLDNVSHELKTPIALIQGYAEGLKENISEDPESREFYCDVIMDESAKMNKLVKNLLTLNQLESGKDEVVMERFDIAELIRGVLQSMDIMIQQKDAKVIFEAESPVYVWADEFKIEEVVTNYTSNALNHLAGERQIEIKLIDEQDRVKITVFNTGKPIPEEDIPNLWNKFYKVDKARTREYGGSGIGLSIVKAIIESLNQEYGVQNYDNGVEFWFTLDRKSQM